MNNISPVSFGKIIKVVGPQKASENISNIANGKNSQNQTIDEKIRSLFDDVKDGRAVVFPVKSKLTYILSGKESQKYDASFKNTLYWLNIECDKYGDEIAEANSDFLWIGHKRVVQELIDSRPITAVITAKEKLHSDEIKSIDIKY
ncbi:hypothetical protein IJ182_04635 [bacterium]|nr:hypothetical protein [bacterium]